MPSILTEYSLEIRDVSEREEWSNAYAGEVPVLAVERDGVQVRRIFTLFPPLNPSL